MGSYGWWNFAVSTYKLDDLKMDEIIDGQSLLFMTIEFATFWCTYGINLTHREELLTDRPGMVLG